MKSCYQDNTGGSVLRKDILNLQNNKVTQASFLKMSSFCFLGFNYNSEASLEDLGLFSLWTETVKPVKKTNKKSKKIENGTSTILIHAKISEIWAIHSTIMNFKNKLK